ncbi:MAG TPA: DmsC/YnfH family molybdoenzyme membrane anchor subunit, partial [Telmatospirillum sp.]|nr:DmsC/YnfH family molybdoenzyme membrane anchor subunit [Telmatospirillum sp.]
MGNEWILVFFTLFAQASVGLVMVMQCFGCGEQAIRGRCLPWAIGLMAVALLIAFLHLGSPFGGYRALYHLGASWLSREVF